MLRMLRVQGRDGGIGRHKGNLLMRPTPDSMAMLGALLILLIPLASRITPHPVQPNPTAPLAGDWFFSGDKVGIVPIWAVTQQSNFNSIADYEVKHQEHNQRRFQRSQGASQGSGRSRDSEPASGESGPRGSSSGPRSAEDR
jgi:hypothetical protein